MGWISTTVHRFQTSTASIRQSVLYGKNGSAAAANYAILVAATTMEMELLILRKVFKKIYRKIYFSNFNSSSKN